MKRKKVNKHLIRVRAHDLKFNLMKTYFIVFFIIQIDRSREITN